ncbi:MAG: hypothetical protein JWM31_3100 [Solirubrobacterales bacterium]|nr:hypothetical protein [Solirubrobacterales bacterium]
MNLARLRAGEALAGAGAVLLTLMLFLDWAKPEYRIRYAGGGDVSSPLEATAKRVTGTFVNQFAQSGWSALGWFLVAMLLISILGALTLVALTVLERDTPVLPVVAAVITTAWSLLAFVVLLLRLTLFQPGLELGWSDRDVNMLAPSWLGLLGLAAIGAGSWLTLRDDRLDSPLSVPPEVPVRPAPPATA